MGKTQERHSHGDLQSRTPCDRTALEGLRMRSHWGHALELCGMRGWEKEDEYLVPVYPPC